MNGGKYFHIPQEHSLQRTQKEAIDYLGGEFRDLLFATHDMHNAGTCLDPIWLYGLGCIIERLAEFLRDPACPVEVYDQSSEQVEPLARSLNELRGKLDHDQEGDGFGFRSQNGLYADLHPNMLPLLSKALEQRAAKADLPLAAVL